MSKNIFDWAEALATSTNIANGLKGYGRTDYTREEVRFRRSHVCLIEADDSTFDDETLLERRGYRL